MSSVKRSTLFSIQINFPCHTSAKYIVDLLLSIYTTINFIQIRLVLGAKLIIIQSKEVLVIANVMKALLQDDSSRVIQQVALPMHLQKEGEQLLYTYGTFRSRRNHPDFFNVPSNALTIGSVLKENSLLQDRVVVLEEVNRILIEEIRQLRGPSTVINNNTGPTTNNNNNITVNIIVKGFGEESVQHLDASAWNATLLEKTLAGFTNAAIDLVHAPQLNRNFYVDPAEPNTIYLKNSGEGCYVEYHIEEVAARLPGKYIVMAENGGATSKLVNRMKRKADGLHEPIPEVTAKVRAKGKAFALIGDKEQDNLDVLQH
jgi:hypothetical protein